VREVGMSFQSPWFLVTLLVLVGAAGIWVVAERRRMRYAVRFTNLDVLASVASGSTRLRLIPTVLFGISLLLLFLALARPHVERLVPKERATVILVVDTSRSMQARDVEPTRLGAAQEAINTFLEDVPDNLNVGLVVFAGEAQVATPPTQDHDLVRTSMEQIDSFLIFGGTAIGDALDSAVQLGKQATEEEPPEDGTVAAPGGRRQFISATQAEECGEEQPPASILFLSDGAQTRGILEPLEGAALAQAACIPVYTIALGTPEGSIPRGSFGGFGTPGSGGSGSDRIPVPPDPETLRQIAEVTGGEFSEARDADSLEKAYSNLGSRLGREPGETEVTFIFIALAAGFLLLSGLFATVVAPRLP
jgi:Ca-activated chloride channel homolog